MQNNQLIQNQRNYQPKHFPSQKIVLNKQGKISLSKSTRVTCQLSAKNQQINLLKSEVLQLKSKLEKEKAESQKISILSDEIRKVKHKLVQKINAKNARQTKNPEQLSDQAISQYFGSSLEQLKYDTVWQNHQKGHEENEKMKQSTYKIFRNFSIFNSATKNSQQKINEVQMKLIQSQQSPHHDEDPRIDMIRQQTARKMNQNKQDMDRSKFKKNLGSFFEDKTVKNENNYQQENSVNKPFFYNKFQRDILLNNKNNLEQTKKFSIVDFKRRTKK